jgi:EpsI family protein
VRAYLRFGLAVVLLAATALLLQARGRYEVFPPRLPLDAFPRQLGNWVGSDVAIPEDTLAVLGKGEFLLRMYHNDSGRSRYVDLFVAYFPSQRAGDTIHSPKNCLPGAGWSPVESSRISLSLPGQTPFPANRYVIAKSTDRSLVLYWYWAHNRGVASEYWAKFYLVADSLRMNRSDGALVRVTTPLRSGEDLDTAQERLLSFAGEFSPILNSYIPQ